MILKTQLAKHGFQGNKIEQMKEYRITIKKQLNAFSFMYYLVVLTLVVLSYYYYIGDLDSELIFYYIIFFLINLTPVIFLHTEYIIRNISYRFIIDINNNCFKLMNDRKGESEVIYFNNVEQIVIYCAPSVWKKKNFKILSFEKYHFARIFTKNHTQFVITNLLMEDIVECLKIVPNVHLKFKRRIFATALY
jgi:hypothetical protein